MVVVLIAAMLLMIVGGTLLQEPLNPHEHPGWFVCYWLVCAWLTLTAILLALFDLLMIRSDARKAERELRAKMEDREPRHQAEP